MFFYYVVGQLFDFILNPILKTIIQQPRPCFDYKEFQLALKNNKRFLYKDGIPYDIFGMPSGHVESAAFSTAFVYLALRKTNWLYLYLIITAITMYQRVNSNEHTISQVIVGAFVGLILANTMYYFSEKNIQGRIREKADDYGPI
jgi:membrane-associated phospholipid phosphatase